jgi:hypothetical protein
LLAQSGRLSVTSTLSVSTGSTRSSPSAATIVLCGPGLLRAEIRSPQASTPFRHRDFQVTTALSPFAARKT